MAFPTVQTRTTGASSATATSHTVTLPATINAGDFLFIAFTSGGGSATTVTWDNTTAGTWTTVASNNSGATVRGTLFSKVADGTEGSAALSITLSTSVQVAWTIWRITGCESSVATASATGSTATVTFGALAPSWGAEDSLWIAVAHLNSTPGVSAYSTGYTDPTGAVGSGVARVSTRSVELLLNAATETPSAWTLGGAAQHVQFTVAIRPAAAALGATLAWFRA
jgi:hypothetical protein